MKTQYLAAVLLLLGCPDEEGSSSGADGGSGPGPGADGGGGGGEIFDNTPATVLSGLEKNWYVCSDGTDGFDLVFRAGGALNVQVDDVLYDGTYAVVGETLQLSVPALSFSETTTDGDIAFGMLSWFRTPSIGCNIVGLDYEADTGEDGYNCPNVFFQEGVGFEHNHFYFTEGGSVRWVHFLELTVGSGDTQREIRLGAYVRQNGRLYMVFGASQTFPDEEYFTGTIDGDGFYADQLQPEKGPCTPL